jgi:hypothetical protein
MPCEEHVPIKSKTNSNPSPINISFPISNPLLASALADLKVVPELAEAFFHLEFQENLNIVVQHKQQGLFL